MIHDKLLEKIELVEKLEQRIKTLESAMQEFINKPGEKLLIPEMKYFKYKFKQLLEEND